MLYSPKLPRENSSASISTDIEKGKVMHDLAKRNSIAAWVLCLVAVLFGAGISQLLSGGEPLVAKSIMLSHLYAAQMGAAWCMVFWMQVTSESSRAKVILSVLSVALALAYMFNAWGEPSASIVIPTIIHVKGFAFGFGLTFMFWLIRHTLVPELKKLLNR